MQVDRDTSKLVMRFAKDFGMKPEEALAKLVAVGDKRQRTLAKWHARVEMVAKEKGVGAGDVRLKALPRRMRQKLRVGERTEAAE